MKVLSIFISFCLLLAASSAKAQSFPKIQKSASARAAYGNAIPFEKHKVKKEKAKKRAKRAAKKKKALNSDRDRYRRGIPI